jgi:hypothetical protein
MLQFPPTPEGKERIVSPDPNALELVLRGWQQKEATVAVSAVGLAMRVVLSGKIRASKQGTWVIGNGRAGLVFDARYATGRIGDPAIVPQAVRECVAAEFVSVIELSLESGDECWFGEIATAAS